jgi:hypothetical protein
MIDMDRLVDGDQPSRARLEQKMQESGSVEGSEFVREFAGLKKVARRSLQSEDRMTVHGLLEKAFNLVSKWDAEARLEEALYALLDSLGSRLIKSTIQERRPDRQRRDNFEPVCHNVLRYGGSPSAC